MDISKKSLETIRQEAGAEMNALHSGKNAREVAADIYRKNLPNKNEDVSALMAEHVEALVREYETQVHDALAHPEAWLDDQLGALLKDKSPVESCQLLYQVLVGVTALGLISDLEDESAIAKAQSMITENQNSSFSATHASQETVAHLREQVKNALGNSNFLAAHLDTLAQQLQALKPEEAARYVVGFGRHAHDMRVIAAMQAYVDAKNGLLKDIPPETSIDEIVLAVCAELDILDTAQRVESGEITEEQGSLIVRLIGMVVGWMLISALLLIATAITLALIPGVIGLISALGLGVVIWDALGEQTIEAAEKVAVGVEKIAVQGVRLILRGLKRLSGWFGSKAKNVLRRMIEEQMEELRQVRRDGAVQEPQVQQNATLSANA